MVDPGRGAEPQSREESKGAQSCSDGSAAISLAVAAAERHAIQLQGASAANGREGGEAAPATTGRHSRPMDKAVAEAASTADEAMAKVASSADEAAAKLASTADEAAAEVAFRADEVVAEDTSKAGEAAAEDASTADDA